MSVNVLEDLMGFTVSTVSYLWSFCFYYYWLYSMWAIIILVCSRLIESLSGKEPRQLANAVSLSLNAPPPQPRTPGLFSVSPLPHVMEATNLLLPLRHCSAKFAKCCFLQSTDTCLIFALKLHSLSFPDRILLIRFRDETQKRKKQKYKKPPLPTLSISQCLPH